jgi:hypothetical protein
MLVYVVPSGGSWRFGTILVLGSVIHANSFLFVIYNYDAVDASDVMLSNSMNDEWLTGKDFK